MEVKEFVNSTKNSLKVIMGIAEILKVIFEDNSQLIEQCL